MLVVLFFFSKEVFIRKILYRRLDSSGLLEVHADGGLGDLQVGQTAEVLHDDREREGRGVRLKNQEDECLSTFSV